MITPVTHLFSSPESHIGSEFCPKLPYRLASVGNGEGVASDVIHGWAGDDVIFFSRTIDETCASWWLNQPNCKICSSKWESSPNFAVKRTKYLSCHHLVCHHYYDPLKKKTWENTRFFQQPPSRMPTNVKNTGLLKAWRLGGRHPGTHMSHEKKNTLLTFKKYWLFFIGILYGCFQK